MIKKNLQSVLSIGFILLNLHLQQMPAVCGEQTPRPVRDETPAAWVSDVSFHFPASKNTVTFSDEDAIDQAGAHGSRRMRMSAELIEHVPYVKSVLAVKERVMARVTPVLENAEGRIFCPFFDRESHERNLPRQEFSSPESMSKSGVKGRDGDVASERYVVGYRLSSRAERPDENWYLGFGWKSGSARHGRRGMEEKDMRSDHMHRTNMMADSEHMSSASVKNEYGGPIVGLVGHF